MSEIIPTPSRIPLVELLDDVPPRLQRFLSDKIANGGLLSRKQFLALVDRLSAADSSLGELLARFSAARAERIAALPERVQEQLAYQKEAVGTALALAGLDRSQLADWNPPAIGIPVSFLDGLSQVRIREDPMIVNDFTRVPGFEAVRGYAYGASVFQDEKGTALTVIIANRQPLEELTGADLIYFNETFASMVMVQYKAMEQEGGEAVYRLPNAQLDDEIRRMDVILDSLRELDTATDVGGFRLSWNPFYLKLCPRIVFRPDDGSLTKGMYIPLEKWKLLVASTDIVGERGGRAVTYDNVKRYFDNTGFINLVANAWIGSTPAQSSVLNEAVRATIESGRAAVIAIKHLATGSDGESSFDIDTLSDESPGAPLK